MPVLDVAERQQELQARVSAVAVARALLLWRRMRAGSLAQLVSSWLAIEQALVGQVSSAQVAAALTADPYMDALEREYGITPDSGLRVQPSALAGLTGGGWPLRDALSSAAVTAGAHLLAGDPGRLALAAGSVNLGMHVLTEVADAGRAAEQVTMGARDWPAGYVRMLEPGACSRCVLLAGKFYRRNAGFDRHPRCRCHHVPKAEDSPDDVRTDPGKYFGSLSKADQDRVFGQAGAEAIRQGADMGQVVNARLGITTATVGGQQVKVTTQGTTRRAYAARVRRAIADARGERNVRRQPRLMPEAILRIAGDDKLMARRLLISNGYIVGDIRALAREVAA